MRTLDVVGLAEVATMLDESKQLVRYWLERERFPKPDAQLAAGPIWRTSKIRRWAENEGRRVVELSDA